jgi:hypothetical protein
VAVFDHDWSPLADKKAKMLLVFWLVVAGYIGVLGTMITDKLVGLVTAVAVAMMLLVLYASNYRSCFEKCWNSVWKCSGVDSDPVGHTAVTQTGVRLVLSAANAAQQGCTLHIPFEDIISIQIQPTATPKYCTVYLTLASTYGGLGYVTYGRNPFMPLMPFRGQTKLAISGLQEPLRFKKLVVAMTDKLSTRECGCCRALKLAWTLWILL